MASERQFRPGSAAQKSVAAAAVGLRQKRQKLVERRDMLIGLDFVLHGAKAVNERDAAVTFGLESLIKNPYAITARDARIFHVWYSAKERAWQFDELPPRKWYFVPYCANNVPAVCYGDDECVCADGSVPQRR